MNCDQVFMILTRGPFPTGEAWDEEVEVHLEQCAGCWRLAEALRPALDVFQEAVPAAEGRDLPGYWGDARPAASVVAELTTATRAGLTAGGGHVSRRSRHSAKSPSQTDVAIDVFRTAVLTSMLTAAVMTLVLWWRG